MFAESTEKAGGNVSTQTEDKNRDFNQNGIKPSNFSSAQRNCKLFYFSFRSFFLFS